MIEEVKTAGKTNSNALTEGPSRAAARSYLRSNGFSKEALLLISALVFAVAAQAQNATANLHAPSQFATAKTIFVANAGDTVEFLPSNTVYAAFYHALSTNGHYTIVTRPADAELSMRLSVEGSSLIRLCVFDTKTGMLLWTLLEAFSSNALAKTRYRNINAASMKLVTELDALASDRLP